MQKRAITCKNTQNRAKKYKNESKQIKTQKHTCTIARTNFGHSRYTTRPCLRGGISKADQPRGAQERPSRSQELAQGCPRGAKNQPKAPQSQPRGTKECPRPFYNQVQRASRPGSSAIFVGSFVRQAPGAIFYCFFVLCVTCTICENHRKTCVFPRFLRIGS